MSERRSPMVVTEIAPAGESITATRTRRLPVAKVGLTPHDALAPLAIGMWIASVRAVNPAAMNDFGLLPALPVAFFVALAILVASIALMLGRETLSPARLGVHLVALVVVLHGTLPLVFDEPIYPWVYKHIGVAGYINLHGGLNSSVDIYHNWPGFFAAAAWMGRIAGVGSPMVYAAWAPVYFNLLTCLMLAFAYRSLPVSQRIRWTALFLFAAGNWVGQDYFAPQAFAFVLSLAVVGMALAWLHADRPPAVLRATRRLVARASDRRPPRSRDEAHDALTSPPPPRAVALAAVFLIFTVVVVSHQLSPYFVVLGLGLLTAAGTVRPRWVVVGLAGVTIGYLLLHLAYLERTQDLFGSLGDPLNNIRDASNDSVPMRGRQLTTLAAPALILGLWGLGSLGVGRRLRRGRPVLTVAILAAAPVMLALGQSYGGEAVFRIYLFSLPWTAVLAACALDPRRAPRAWTATKVGVTLGVTAALFLSAFYGSAELYVVHAGEVEASAYFYDHAEHDSVLTLGAANFPARVGDRYDQFRLTGDSLPNLLTTVAQFRHRMLGAEDLDAVAAFVGGYVPGGGRRYLALSTGQARYAEVLGLLPRGSLAALDAALAASPSWSVYLRNSDAVIYRFEPTPGDEAVGGPVADPAPAVALVRQRDRSVHWPGVVLGVLGLALIVVALVRRRRATAHPIEVVPETEEAMSLTGWNRGSRGAPDRVAASEEIAASAVAAPTGPGDEGLVRTPAAARDSSGTELIHAEPEGDGLADAVADVEPVHRPAAVRELGEAEGPLPRLHPLLGHHSAAVRAAAVEVLDRSEGSVAYLHQLLREDLSADVRVAAIAALAGAPEAEQLSALQAASADPDPRVRAAALRLLPVAGTTKAAAVVLMAAEDEDETVRCAAYQRIAVAPFWVVWNALDRCSRCHEIYAVLAREAPEDRLEDLALERLASPVTMQRVVAVELAGRARTAACRTATIDALGDQEPAVRGAAAAQLGGRPEALPALIATLQHDPDPTVRVEAALALRGSDTDDGLLALVAALADPHPIVRRVASQTVVDRASPALAHRVAAQLTTANTASVGDVLLGMGRVGEEALTAVLVEGSRDRASAAAGLLRRGGGVETFREGLNAVDPHTRLRAVDVLGALGGPEAIDGLVAALSDSAPAIRGRASVHLGRVGDERSRQALVSLADADQVAYVVRAARVAVALIERGATGTNGSVNGHWPETAPQPVDV